MLRKTNHSKLIFLLMLLIIANLSIASFSSNSGDKNKFSLKTLSAISKNFSLTLLHAKNLQFKGLEDLNKQNEDNGVEINSMVRLQNGNTTYVYPYKYVIKLPKFKTPSQSPSSTQ